MKCGKPVSGEYKTIKEVGDNEYQTCQFCNCDCISDTKFKSNKKSGKKGGRGKIDDLK